MPGKTVMVVDDEQDIQTLVKAVLEGEGFEVVVASSGQECLEMLKNEKPDLILMDMMMPGMSGRETSKKIRDDPSTKNVKIAFLTVARFSETGEKTLKAMNISDYITKPFENTDLVKRVKKILGS